MAATETACVSRETAAGQPYGIVYLARNTVNGKGYVGQTTKGLESRKQGHYREAKGYPGPPFPCAIREHGIDVFAWQVLTECHSQKDLDTAERMYIAVLRTKRDNGYNVLSGGNGHGPMSAEMRQQIREKALAFKRAWVLDNGD